MTMLQLSLGPILWFWSRRSVFDFYADAAEWPVDIIYLGETVCSRRRELSLPDWLDIARVLQSQGKTVVLSSLNLVESEADLRTLRKLCRQHEFVVEVNDQSALQLVCEEGLPFVTGPAMNIYNARTLSLLLQKGLQRWCLPVELSKQALQNLLEELHQAKLAAPVEVFSWGFLPLAWSSRCFTARHYNLPKDNCEFRCLQHPDGLELRSREAQSLFRINGTSTLSGSRYDLAYQLGAMSSMGVAVARLSPEHQGMAEIVAHFDALRRGQTLPEPLDPLKLVEAPPCDGYWYGLPGMDSVTSS